ncbi:MAG: saccharopine dehydrogenase family protein, partial [Gemmatimonadota bacterium]
MSGAGELLVYGAYGYSGDLVVRRAVARGLRPVLAGRREEPLRRLADETGLRWRRFELSSPSETAGGVAGAAAVLNCAGPFVHTAEALLEACLAGGAHYLDITGEIAVFESLAARDAEALDARVVVLPGVGFDVVPSDCLAAHVARALPSATKLVIGIDSRGGVSRGTAMSMLERLPRGGAVRVDGALRTEPIGARRRRFDFGHGPREAISIPWGDLATAWRSTGIPNIEVYSTTPSRA